MLKELEAIETKDVEALVEIKREHDVVQQLIEKATSSKDKVPALIYERVMADYDARLKALEAQARPLRQSARAEFAKLKALHTRLTGGLESAKLDLSELEFRHEIGELTDDVFETRRTAAQEALNTSQTDFDDADKIRARFLEVIPTEPEPAPPPEPPAPPPAPPPPAPAPAPPAPAVAVQEVTDAHTPRPPDLAAPEPEGGFGTVIVKADEMPPPPEPGGDFGTLVMAGARLIRQDNGVAGPEYVLGPLTTIGRTPDNSIPLDRQEVSRKHARIVVDNDGVFTLFDNGSNNGTYVNGDRITEHRLRDGDRVQIGTHDFVFHQ
jgi:hypothetical protein